MHTARHRVVQKRMPRHTHTRKINGRENSHVTCTFLRMLLLRF